MLDHLNGRASNRKLRLFACACARRVIHRIPGIDADRLIRLAESDVDGEASDYEVRKALKLLETCVTAGYRGVERDWYPQADAGQTLQNCFQRFRRWGWGAAWRNCAVPKSLDTYGARDTDYEEAYPERADLLREIFGNPFTIAAVISSPMSTQVMAFAESIYDEGAFGRMPELATLLENTAMDGRVLDHCRQPKPHAKGCWALDIVLGIDESGEYETQSPTASGGG